MIDIATVIKSLRPNSEFTVQNDDYSTIEWHVLEGKAPTKTEVESEKTRLESALVAAESANAAAKEALLARLGITAEEAKLLLS
jgi:hypothetical protein